MDPDNEIRLRILSILQRLSTKTRIFYRSEHSKNCIYEKSPDYLCQNQRLSHLRFYIKGDKKRYWSPHLHLELENFKVRKRNPYPIDIYGPDPIILWTLTYRLPNAFYDWSALSSSFVVLEPTHIMYSTYIRGQCLDPNRTFYG